MNSIIKTTLTIIAMLFCVSALLRDIPIPEDIIARARRFEACWPECRITFEKQKIFQKDVLRCKVHCDGFADVYNEEEAVEFYKARIYESVLRNGCKVLYDIAVNFE